MAIRNIPPTKTNLLKLKEELKFAKLGYELLDQKRNILIIELLGIVDQAVDIQNQIEEALDRAFRSLEEAIAHSGKLQIKSIAFAMNLKSEVKIRVRKVMGVTLPVVETQFEENPPYFSGIGMSFWVDEAIKNFMQVLKIMGRFAELKISVVRLAEEVKKTIRKVNALEKIAIPDLEETVQNIESRLEESEREMFNLMKMVKESIEESRRH